jgi:hypothetical protein
MFWLLILQFVGILFPSNSTAFVGNATNFASNFAFESLFILDFPDILDSVDRLLPRL